jgi:hypothetical protein
MSKLTAITLGLVLTTGAASVHAQGTGTDTEETTGPPSTLTTEDTRGGATGTGAMDDPVPTTSPDAATATLDEDQLNMGNPEENNDAGNWGWLGLLGLAGLMGRRRADRDAPIARRDATAR